MQDTKNLITKRDKTIPKLIRECEVSKDYLGVEYWTAELDQITKRIETRNKNRFKNNRKK